MTPTSKLLFVVNDADFFLSHRLPIAQAAQAAGYQVHVATPPGAAVARIVRHGLRHHPIPLTRSGGKPWQELASLATLYRLYRRLRPDLVHHVTIKPVLYGGIAARLAGVPAVVSAVSGLGYAFSGDGPLAGPRRRLIERLYRLALNQRNGHVILQNPDDRRALLGAETVAAEQTVLIRGSGVDLQQFRPQPEPAGEPVVVLPARMLRAKGVEEFVDAAQRLRRAGVRARFALVGASDPGNPTAVSEAQLRHWAENGDVEWWGHCRDMPAVLAQAHIVCLPSHGEGLPKSLLEAAACGLPLVATDVCGCREAVRHGDNGLLVPLRNPPALAKALKQLIEQPDLRRAMGRRSRERALAEFGLEAVVTATLGVYRQLLSGEGKRSARRPAPLRPLRAGTRQQDRPHAR